MELTRRPSKISVITLAEYILYLLGEMSHLKLQKLVYLIEGYHLAYFDGENLIEDDFQAWTHGPVCRRLFDILKDKSILYGDVRYVQNEGEVLPDVILSGQLVSEQIELINEVIGMYKNESGMALESITHQQAPWINARKGLPYYAKCENIISKEDMRNYFRSLVEI